MTLEVETIVAVSLMMAVFSAVAAVGSSIILGAGFERLRAGFDVVRKQTGFFSDALHQLEKKVETVDRQAGEFSHNINRLEARVESFGDQANAFAETVQGLEKKVDIVDKQSGFFSDSLYQLEKKVEAGAVHESPSTEHGEEHVLISTGKAEALVSHAENLLNQMASLAIQMHVPQPSNPAHSLCAETHLTMPTVSDQSLLHMSHEPNRPNQKEEICYH